MHARTLTIVTSSSEQDSVWLLSVQHGTCSHAIGGRQLGCCVLESLQHGLRHRPQQMPHTCAISHESAWQAGTELAVIVHLINRYAAGQVATAPNQALQHPKMPNLFLRLGGLMGARMVLAGRSSALYMVVAKAKSTGAQSKIIEATVRSDAPCPSPPALDLMLHTSLTFCLRTAAFQRTVCLIAKAVSSLHADFPKFVRHGAWLFNLAAVASYIYRSDSVARRIPKLTHIAVAVQHCHQLRMQGGIPTLCGSTELAHASDQLIIN